ncbi:MAG: helix-turn-helix transcriptional regulator [Bryobacterales bacterium]|nr:helix-turn-helix transcriptional regulator [Bryobacterales bacterium]
MEPSPAAARWTGVDFATAEEDISGGVCWQIPASQRDVLIVHLGGPIRRLQTNLSGCGAALAPPAAGELWIAPAGVDYEARAEGGLVRYAEIHLDRSAVPASRGETDPKHAALAPVAGFYDPFLHHSVVRLDELSRRNDDVSRIAAHALSQALLLHVHAAYSDGVRAAHRSRPLEAGFKARLERYIDERLSSAIRLEDLAAQARMTAHELLPAFRAAFGATPAQYVIAQRVRRARWLLESSTKTIAEVAFETGFSSHAHLTSTFQRRLGAPPRAFRPARRTTIGR